MLWNSAKLFAVAGIVVTSVVLAGTTEKTIDPHFKAVLDARVVSVTPLDVSSDLEKVNRLFESIDRLARRGKEADNLLVELLDYYLGEGPGTDMATLILERGKRMIPILTEKKRHPLNCLPAYKSICIDDLKTRNERIDDLIDEIKPGRVGTPSVPTRKE